MGRIVYKAAAKHLTPVLLEMGGKNPCFVTKNADIPSAALRLVWGKTGNTGQMCICPVSMDSLCHITSMNSYDV